MAVAPDNNSTAWAIATATSVSDNTNTVGAGATLLIAFVSAHAAAIPAGLSVVWDSGGTNQTMTQITNTAVESADGLMWQALYGVVNPTTGAKTCTLSVTSSTELHLLTQSFTGSVGSSVAAATRNGTTAFNNFSTPSSFSISSATNNYTVSLTSEDTGIYNGGTHNQTLIGAIDTSTGNHNSLPQRAAGAAGVTHTTTVSGGAGFSWCGSGCDIVVAPPVVPGGNLPLLGVG